jgi:uncharacterized protein with PIN domain
LKFVADGMLGKLTRWLRILGYDVKYFAKMHDAELIMVSRKEKRALITRDLELYKQATAKGVDALYLEGQTGEEKLAEVAKRFSLSLNVNVAKSRCSKCNSRVEPIPKKNVANKVENSTYVHYDEFWQCPKCGQIYWQGAHWTKIRKTLEKASECIGPNGS